MKAKRFLMIPVALLAIAGFAAAVMLLWNALIPTIFGLVTINFWQALGLLALTRILFGGIGKGMGGRGGFGKMHGHGHRNEIREKWMQMTPEERKEFVGKRKRFGRDCFGGHPFDDGRFDKKDNQDKANE